MNRGSIVHFKDFKFHDGAAGDKYLIVLNQAQDKSEPILFAKTTSKQKFRNYINGCCTQYFCYLIFAKTDWFKEDTWVLLDEIYPYKFEEILNAKFNSQQLVYKANLNLETINNISDCCSHSPDIERKYKKMISA